MYTKVAKKIFYVSFVEFIRILEELFISVAIVVKKQKPLRAQGIANGVHKGLPSISKHFHS